MDDGSFETFRTELSALLAHPMELPPDDGGGVSADQLADGVLALLARYGVDLHET
jgi:hypothetical protein